MSLKKGFLYVFSATVIGFIINLITSFVFPKFLSVETYANIKLYQMYITYVGILHFGFSDGMYLRLGGKNIQSVDKAELLSEFKTFKLFQLVVDIFFVLLSLLIKDNILLIVSASILPVNIINYLKNLYQATGLYDLYSFFTTVNNVMLFCVNIILLMFVKTDNAYFYIIGNFLVYIINTLIIECVIRKKFFNGVKSKVDFKYLICDIKEGLLLMLGNFCNVVFTSVDRIFVKYFLGITKFAYYSFAVSVEGLINIFITPISVMMYNFFCRQKSKEKICIIKNSLLILVSLLLSSSFAVKYVILNFVTKYQESSNIIFILFAAQFFAIVVKCIHTNLYKSFRKQNRYFWIIVFVTLLAVLLDYFGFLLLNSNEMYAIATLVTCIAWFIFGEKDFADYRYPFKSYVFIAFVISCYLFFGLFISNAIIGMILYLFFDIIFIILFVKKDFYYLIKQAKDLFNKVRERVLK